MMKYFAFIILIFVTQNVFASKVYYGGVSFSSWDQKESAYPNISKFLCKGENAICENGNIDIWARNYLESFKSENFDVSIDLISGNAVEGVIMTPMISGESLNIVKDVTGNKESYIHVYRVFASMMFFEFSTGRFIASRPVVVQYTDTLNEPADEKSVLLTFKKLLDGSLESSNLFSQMFKASENVTPFTFSNKLIRMATIDVSSAASDGLKNINLKAWKESIKKQAEAYLVKNTEGPFVPSLNNDSATQEFSATFANAARTIKLPSEVAFNIGIEINNLKPIVKVNRKQQTVCHAVSLKIFADGLMDKVFEGTFVRTKESCGVISADKKIDHDYYLTQSIYSLLNEISQNINENPDKDFLKRSSGKKLKNNKEMLKEAYAEVFSSDF